MLASSHFAPTACDSGWSDGERYVDLLLSAETSEPVEAFRLTLAAGRNGFCLSFPSASSSLPSGCPRPASPKPLPVCLWRFSPCAMLCMAASRTLIKYPFSLSTSVFLHCITVTNFFALSHLCYCFVWSHLYWTNSCASSPQRHTEANVDYVTAG